MGRRNRSLHNKKGFAYVLALFVFFALFVLGVAILGMVTNEAKLTGRQYSRTQAYYSARSGVEIGLAKMVTALNTGMGYTDVTDLYNALGSTFSGSVVNGKDTFVVNFVDGGLVAQDKIKIYAQATQNNVQATTAITLNVQSPFFDLSGWIHPISGIVKKDEHTRVEGPVVVKLEKTVGHAPKKVTNAEDTTWISPAIHFIDIDADGLSFEITTKSMEFRTNLLSFSGKIYTGKVGALDTDAFILDTYTLDGSLGGFYYDDGSKLKLQGNIDIPDGWGVVVFYDDVVAGNNINSATETFNEGYYAYKPGTQFSNPTQRTSTDYMKEITVQASKDFIDEVVRRNTTLSIDVQNARWSQK